MGFHVEPQLHQEQVLEDAFMRLLSKDEESMNVNDTNGCLNFEDCFYQFLKFSCLRIKDKLLLPSGPFQEVARLLTVLFL